MSEFYPVKKSILLNFDSTRDILQKIDCIYIEHGIKNAWSCKIVTGDVLRTCEDFSPV